MGYAMASMRGLRTSTWLPQWLWRKIGPQVTALRDACMSDKNLVPFVLDAVRAHATLGEISDLFREAYGVYREPAVF